MTEALDDKVRGLLRVGELADVRFLSFSAALRDELRDDIDEDALTSSTQVVVGNTPSVLEVRMYFEAATRAADYEVVAATQFHFEDGAEIEVSEELGRAFAERVGVMAIYPYIREAMQAMSVRLRQDAVTLPLLRLGGMSLGNPRSFQGKALVGSKKSLPAAE